MDKNIDKKNGKEISRSDNLSLDSPLVLYSLGIISAILGILIAIFGSVYKDTQKANIGAIAVTCFSLLLIFLVKRTQKSRKVIMEEIKADLKNEGIAYIGSNRKRIAIMLPISCYGDLHFRDEMVYAFKGIASAYSTFVKKGSNLNEFELLYLDHKNDPKDANDLISLELERGTRLFLCTNSKVCTELTKEKSDYYFLKTLKTFKTKNNAVDDNAILLCTLATSKQIIPHDNYIYRYFINSAKESFFIIEEILHKDEWKKGDLAIVYNISNEHSYADEAVMNYTKKWNEDLPNSKVGEIVINLDQEISARNAEGNEQKIKIRMSRVAIKQFVDEKFKSIENISKINSSKIIIVIAFNSCSIEVIKNLSKLIQPGSDKCVIFPSIFPGIGSIIENEEEAYEELIELVKNCSVYHSIPLKEGPNNFYGEIAEYFTMASMYRLMKCAAGESDLKNFHNNWQDLEFPQSLKIKDPSTEALRYADIEHRLVLKRIIFKYNKLIYE